VAKGKEKLRPDHWCAYCDSPRLPGKNFCQQHLDELDRELDQLAAMPPGCDAYGSLD
jgi:hypothetical protein